MKRIGLCFRCEQRARVMEGEHGPRYECNEKTSSRVSCYMYRPVRPVVTKKAPGYKKRPRFGPGLICAREMAVEVCSDKHGLLVPRDLGRGKVCLFWMPKAVMTCSDAKVPDKKVKVWIKGE